MEGQVFAPGQQNPVVEDLAVSANYFQAYSVTGAGSYPTYHGKAETGLNYVNNPAFRRMTTTTINTMRAVLFIGGSNALAKVSALGANTANAGP